MLPAFFNRVLGLKGEEGAAGMRMHERVAYLVFAINAFQVRCAAGAAGVTCGCGGAWSG